MQKLFRHGSERIYNLFIMCCLLCSMNLFACFSENTKTMCMVWLKCVIWCLWIMFKGFGKHTLAHTYNVVMLHTRVVMSEALLLELTVAGLSSVMRQHLRAPICLKVYLTLCVLSTKLLWWGAEADSCSIKGCVATGHWKCFSWGLLCWASQSAARKTKALISTLRPKSWGVQPLQSGQFHRW